MINKRLDWISRQLGLLEITQHIPAEADVDSTQIKNRAMDVLSAVFVFLEVNIDHEISRLGVVGMIMKELG
jgi:hypothetical protein